MLNFGFIVTLAFIVILIPAISYFVGQFRSLAVEFGGASLSLLVALYVQLFHAPSPSNAILALLILLTIVHGAGVPFVIVLARVHRIDKSFGFAFFAFPSSLLLSQGLLFLTASMTLNANGLIQLKLSAEQKADVVIDVLFGNDVIYIFYVLIVMLVLMTLLRLAFFTKEWKSTHAAPAAVGMPTTSAKPSGDS